MSKRFRTTTVLFFISLMFVTNIIAQENSQTQPQPQPPIPPEIKEQLTPEQIEKIQQQQGEEGQIVPSTETEAEKVQEAEGETITEEAVTEEGVEEAKPEETVTEEAEETKEEVEETEEETEAQKELKEPAEPALKKFGDNYFKSARERILNIEKQGGTLASAVMKDAITGFVGPVDMANANIQATIPQGYLIRPGDKLSIMYWGPEITEPKTINVTVDSEGQVIIPQVGKVPVRGMTLEQFEKSVRDMLARITYEDLKLIATFEKLRSIQIFIIGNAFRPGAYAVSSVTTLFNALYLSGGPDADGSLRDIILLRGKKSFEVDFYKYLMYGDSSQDHNLQGGDTIFIPPIGRTASIKGEVNRPGIYELRDDQNLMALIEMARGVRPSGLKKRIQIQSVEPNQERIVVDVNLDKLDGDKELFDGDVVNVFPVLPEYQNTVTLEGSVTRPGTYELKTGMKVSELIESADGVLGEAHLDRADLFRLNYDMRTTSLIPINLGKALAGDSENDIMLQRWDRLVVYSKWDVEWIAERLVKVQGAVQKPGSFERSDNMKVNDLLIQAGGVTPKAYTKKAILFRLDERQRVAKSIPLNLELVTKKDPNENILLKDGDTLYVYKWEEVVWEPKREVTSTGNLQDPGTYPWIEGMRVSNLIYQSGGVLPDTADTALLLRRDRERWRISESIKVNLKEILNGNKNADIPLLEGDVLTVYTKEEIAWEPIPEVSVTGAVQSGGKFPKVENMKITDLIFRAGGLLPNAYLERAELIRPVPPDYEQFQTIPVELGKAVAGVPEADLLLEKQDSLRVYTITEAEFVPEHIVTIYGAVQRPDTYTKTQEMRLSDLIFAAGGITPGAGEFIEIAKARCFEKTAIQRIKLTDFQERKPDANPLLDDGDVVAISKKKSFIEKPRYVVIKGEVNNPGTYVLEDEKTTISQLIERAGGITDEAYLPGAIFNRLEADIISLDQKQQAIRIWEDWRREKDLEYIRELAKSRVKSETAKETSEMLQSATPTLSPTTLATQTVGTAAEEVAEGLAGTPSGEEQMIEQKDLRQLTQKGVTTAVEAGDTEINLVTPARDISMDLPSKRILIDLEKALSSPNSEYDIALKEGDEITIPVQPISITVIGAVINPISFAYRPEAKLEDYVRMAGGYSNDADEKGIYVISSNGVATNKKDVNQIMPGDMIIVPTKVMVEEVSDRWGQIVGVIKFVAITVSTAYLVGRILK